MTYRTNSGCKAVNFSGNTDISRQSDGIPAGIADLRGHRLEASVISTSDDGRRATPGETPGERGTQSI